MLHHILRYTCIPYISDYRVTGMPVEMWLKCLGVVTQSLGRAAFFLIIRYWMRLRRNKPCADVSFCSYLLPSLSPTWVSIDTSRQQVADHLSGRRKLWILLEKLIVAHLFKKLPTYYVIWRMSITVSHESATGPYPLATWIQSTFYRISLRSGLILSSQLR